MGGANLEVFKFGFYMFFPIFIMFKFGDPDWYDEYVLPYKDKLWPAYETTYKPPRNPQELQAELAKMRARHQAQRDRLNAANGSSDPSTTEGISTSSPTPPISVLDEVESRGIKPDWKGTDRRLV